MHELLDNGHEWRELYGIENGKLVEKPVRSSPLPDGLFVLERWKTSVGYVSYALYQVKKGRFAVVIPPTYKRDDPELSYAEWVAECRSKGVLEQRQISMLQSKPEKERSGCVCMRLLERIPVKLEGEELKIRNRKGRLTQDGKMWVGSFGDQVFAGKKKEAFAWLSGRVLSAAYPSLHFEGDRAILEWKETGSKRGEVRAGMVRLSIVFTDGRWQWEARIGEHVASGSEETRRKAQRAASAILGAV